MNRRVSFQYELLSKTMQHKKWLYNIMSCSIQWQSLTQLKNSAKIEMLSDEAIDYINDRIKVYATLNGTQFPLGVFLLCSSDKVTNVISIRDCECYSLLQLLLDRKLEEKLQVVAGTNVINEVIRLIGDTGDYSIPSSDKTLLGEKIYEINTSYLEVINDLLDTVNYTPLYCDLNGVYTSKPYVLPQNRTHNLIFRADLATLVKPQIVDSLDIFNVPNVFTVYTDSIDIPPMRYTYVNDRPDSITSTVNRNRRICTSEKVEATSIDDLVEKAKKMCDEANSKFAHLELEVALRSDLNLYDDCIWVKLNDIDSKYILYNVSYNCKVGETMKIKLRKVVDLFV